MPKECDVQSGKPSHGVVVSRTACVTPLSGQSSIPERAKRHSESPQATEEVPSGRKTSIVRPRSPSVGHAVVQICFKATQVCPSWAHLGAPSSILDPRGVPKLFQNCLQLASLTHREKNGRHEVLFLKVDEISSKLPRSNARETGTKKAAFCAVLRG